MTSLYFRRIYRVYAYDSGNTKSSLSSSTTFYNETRRNFKSKAVFESLITAAEEKIPNLILYNYLPFLVLIKLSLLTFTILIFKILISFCLFSLVEPLRV
ncbi:hypothetical protein MKW98_026580 [Papaver atlanticum]|uniref:Uncharacterized protein n=1 Tax=Papaver atlanticum TaxID=357466 RepID=A0AAD4RZK4_9MAGN|nr:hypothetical protein MKW98_026580 [Papaver atlanticum]